MQKTTVRISSSDTRDTPKCFMVSKYDNALKKGCSSKLRLHRCKLLLPFTGFSSALIEATVNVSAVQIFVVGFMLGQYGTKVQRKTKQILVKNHFRSPTPTALFSHY